MVFITVVYLSEQEFPNNALLVYLERECRQRLLGGPQAAPINIVKFFSSAVSKALMEFRSAQAAQQRGDHAVQSALYAMGYPEPPPISPQPIVHEVRATWSHAASPRQCEHEEQQERKQEAAYEAQDYTSTKPDVEAAGAESGKEELEKQNGDVFWIMFP